MKFPFLQLFATAALAAYNRTAAREYALRWWNAANHDCTMPFQACSPYSYWGDEACGETSHGGDSANFASQCLLAGGHSWLSTGGACRGHPCGSEEVHPANLALCLNKNFAWNSTCGKHLPPPAHVIVGDVVVFHRASCESFEAHAALVTSVHSNSAFVTCHSPNSLDVDYNVFAKDYPFVEYLHFLDPIIS